MLDLLTENLSVLDVAIGSVVAGFVAAVFTAIGAHIRGGY